MMHETNNENQKNVWQTYTYICSDNSFGEIKKRMQPVWRKIKRAKQKSTQEMYKTNLNNNKKKTK